MLNARNLKLSFGRHIILDDVSFSLLPKDKIALVGQNGAGKSSLLRIVAGDPPDSGVIETNKNTRIGFLKQEPELSHELSVIETVRLSMAQHLADIALHQHLCGELANLGKSKEQEQLHHRIEALADRIEQQGGFDVDYWMERVLTRLGIKAREQKIGSLSGGERRRVDLARVLLMAPDIYLLDEPTNHIDVQAISFLLDFFSKSSSAVLFVSHDSLFIDELSTRIWELSHGTLYTHEPPFSNYLEKKLIRELIDARTLHRKERLVARELLWLRAGTPARTTKQNARIDRAYELIDQVAKDNETQRKKQLDMEISKSKRLGTTILELDHVGMAYGTRILFKNLNLKVLPLKRYGILGANGSGKTTLLSILAKKMVPTFGHVIYGKNTQVVEFDQQREQLDKNKTLKETLADHGDYVRIDEKNIHIARYLEKYLFSAEDAHRYVNTLSGGEQNRLLLGKLLSKASNCLLLDEPTNDLDVTSLAVLEEVLLEYEGVAFIVSHDRRFLDRVCTNIIAFEPAINPKDGENKIEIYPGNYSDYVHLSSLAQKNLSIKPENKAIKSSVRPEATKIKKRRNYKEEKEFLEIEIIIEGLEEERKTLHRELAHVTLFKNEPEKIKIKLTRLTEIEHEIERLYARWQYLMDLDG